MWKEFLNLNPQRQHFERQDDLIPISSPRLETESLSVQAVTPPPAGTPSAQWFGTFNDAKASGGAGAYFNATAPGQSITYHVTVPGECSVYIGIQTKPNKGKFRVAVNGVDQGVESDGYSPTVGYTEANTGDLIFIPSPLGGIVDADLTFTVSGKNPSSTGYTLALDYIRFK